MLCEKCHKNEANISVSTMVNGVTRNYHLCSACAEKQNLFQNAFEDDLFNNFLGKTIFSFPFDATNNFFNQNSQEQIKCSFCGQSLNDFKQTGLFGCPHCYQEFRTLIEPILDEIHGSHIYLEKDMPAKNSDQTDIDDIQVKTNKAEADFEKDHPAEEQKSAQKIAYETMLEKMKDQLKQYVSKEEYEKAAEQRDRIREFTFEKYLEQQEKKEGEQ